MRAYVYGGGPSLREFDWAGALPGLEISCNGHVPDDRAAPAVVLSADRTYWRDKRPHGHQQALRVFVAHDGPGLPGLLNLPGAGSLWEHCWSDSLAGGLMVGGCSGVPALHLAVLCGATEVHLVGIDLEGGRLTESTWAKTREAFSFAVERAREAGVEVIGHGRWKP